MSPFNDLELEQFHLGEADEEVRQRVLGHPDAAARLAALASADAAFHAQHNARDLIARIERRARPAQRKWGLAALVLIPALAVLLVVMTQVTPPDQSVVGPDGITNVKGLKPRLHVYRKVNGMPVSVSNGSVLRAGDQLQLAVTAGDALHGVVLSIDGHDNVTVHLPSPGADTRLLPGRRPLPNGYELDDAPEFERFFLVAAGRPLDVARITDAANALIAQRAARDGVLSLGDDIVVSSVLVRKGG